MSKGLERYFHLKTHRTTAKTEFLAGLTTFSTMAYITIVNPAILSAAGMDFNAVMVATILSACVSTLIMGLFANYPFALAPSMGLNVYFTYGIVEALGLSWQTALAACFLAALTLIVLNLLGIRQALLEATPACLRTGTTAGIGIFLAFIGMKETHIVIEHPQTLITVGNLIHPDAALTLAGVVIIAALQAYRVQSAMLWTILLLWIIGLGSGLASWKGIIAWPPSMAPTWLQLDLQGLSDPKILSVTLSFVFVMIFDAAGSLMSLAHHGGFISPEGHIPRVRRAFSADAFGTLFGALAGTSPMTNYLESASGISAGGRTGLTAVVVAFSFLALLFFAPLSSSVPLFATCPVLIVVGAQMAAQLKKLDWEDPTEMIPGFMTLISIPLTFNIAAGIGIGFVSYTFLKLLTGKGKATHPLAWVVTLLFLIQASLNRL